MRSAECPDAAAAASPQAEEVRVSDPPPAADSGQAVLQVSGQAPAADSGQVLVFAPLDQPRELVGFRHLLLRIVPLRRGRLFPAGATSPGSTVRLDFAAFIVLVFLTAALDAPRLSSSAADSSEAAYSWVRPSILLTTVITTPITMERRRRNRLS